MIHRNAYTSEVNWERTMLDAGPWIAVVALLLIAAGRGPRRSPTGER